MDRRINSGDKNVIGHNTQIHGNLILGDNSGNSDKSSNNNNTESSDTTSNNSNSANFVPLVGVNIEVNCRVNSGDKNVIGHNTQIHGNPIVGDNSGNNDNPVVKGNSDKIDDNPVVKGNSYKIDGNTKSPIDNNKVDYSDDSGDKKIIGHDTQVHGNPILIDGSSNSSEIDDNPSSMTEMSSKLDNLRGFLGKHLSKFKQKRDR